MPKRKKLALFGEVRVSDRDLGHLAIALDIAVESSLENWLPTIYNMYILYTHIHVHIHIHIHTYMHACMHAYIHTYKSIQTYIHTYIQIACRVFRLCLDHVLANGRSLHRED